MRLDNRRTFLFRLAGGSAVLASSALAQPAPKLPETDPQAIALGYRLDTTKVDAKKFPKHEVAQKCGNCQLYQGAANDAFGPCPLFAGKLVSVNGWCSAWVKRAA